MASHFASLAAARSNLGTKKPEADNVLKGIKDGSNEIIWRDDEQVMRIYIEKQCSETPGALVDVMTAGGAAA
jgi:Holliday junction resolvase RusA-like endonuclease